jgi:hypothetical protein
VSGWALTTYGVLALTFMMTMYGLEGRGPAFVLAFAAGCLLASSYGFLSGAWPFGVVEAIWALVAVRRYRRQRTPRGPGAPPGRQTTGGSPGSGTTPG